VSTEERIRKFLLEELQLKDSRAELTDDLPLIEGHVIDSLDMLKLVALIEEEFGIDVEDEDLVPDNFASIREIAKFVDSKRGA